MKKNVLSHFSCLFLLAAMTVSCNNKKLSSDINSTPDGEKIAINCGTVDSILFIPIDGSPILMNRADCKPLSEYLSTAVYDTILNRGDIMIKMQAPDYTAVFYYKGKSADESDWLMVWNENGRTKFRNKWYMLSEKNRDKVYSLLEKYNKPAE